MLQRPSGDLAAIGQHHGIIDRAALRNHRADQHCRSGFGGGGDQAVGRFMRPPDKLGLEDQILGRIARQLQLREHDQIGALGLVPPFEHRRRIGFEVADALVQLGEGDGRGARSCSHAHLASATPSAQRLGRLGGRKGTKGSR
jgi:hypothetical protein